MLTLINTSYVNMNQYLVLCGLFLKYALMLQVQIEVEVIFTFNIYSITWITHIFH